MMLEDYLERDDRIVLPVGSTEQHAYLSLATDNILAERVAVEAAEPLGVPVLPVLAFGVAPAFAAYPGSPSLTAETFTAVLTELVSSLRSQGFRRVLVVNGHGGNTAAGEWIAGDGVRWHDWWVGPRVSRVIEEIGLEGSHASWMENFPWTRLPGVDLPAEPKPTLTVARDLDPYELRRLLGDGSFGGPYSAPDEQVLRIWRAGVEETRALLEGL